MAGINNLAAVPKRRMIRASLMIAGRVPITNATLPMVLIGANSRGRSGWGSRGPSGADEGVEFLNFAMQRVTCMANLEMTPDFVSAALSEPPP